MTLCAGGLVADGSKGKAKVVQTECNGKGKAEGFSFALLRCSLTLCKSSAFLWCGKGAGEGKSLRVE